MPILVPLLLSVALPQDPPSQAVRPAQDPAAAAGKPALLSAAEQATLRNKLMRYLADDAAYNRLSGKEREKAARAREKTKEDFDSEWKKLEKKGNLLGSMTDLRAVFDNCFLVKAPQVSLGSLRTEKLKELDVEFAYFLPKTYKVDKPVRTVVVLPGTSAADAAAAWTKPADYFAATWDKSASSNDAIFHLPTVPAGLELDPIPDYSREGAEEEEERRIRLVWASFGDTMSSYNLDRGRIFLDAGRGACGFALRFVTLFPDRFAGIVLRQPTEVDDLRLGSLTGTAVLLLRTPATAAVVDALQQRLQEAAPGSATVLDAADEYPHKGSTAAIEDWMQKQRRNMSPSKVVIEPNHDRHNRAYWVDIDTADSLLTASPDKKPRLEVQADRAANRITVKAVGVERFTLLLNDDLVDLDKDFTVVVNDKAVQEKRTRSFRDLRDRVIQRSDWEYLFPVMFSTVVPKQ